MCSPIIAFVREPINFTGVNNFRFYGVRVQCHKTAAELVFFFLLLRLRIWNFRDISLFWALVILSRTLVESGFTTSRLISEVRGTPWERRFRRTAQRFDVSSHAPYITRVISRSRSSGRTMNISSSCSCEGYCKVFGRAVRLNPRTRGASHYAKDSGNFGRNSNGKVRFGFFWPEYSGSPLEVVHIFRSAVFRPKFVVPFLTNRFLALIRKFGNKI